MDPWQVGPCQVAVHVRAHQSAHAPAFLVVARYRPADARGHVVGSDALVRFAFAGHRRVDGDEYRFDAETFGGPEQGGRLFSGGVDVQLEEEGLVGFAGAGDGFERVRCVAGDLRASRLDILRQIG